MIALPAAAIESVARPDRGEEADAAEADPETPVQPPSNIGMPPARALSRDSVCNAVVSAARAHDLPVPFFANLIWQESNFKSTAISRAGAQGIAQFMPRTAAELGLLNPFEPIQALFTAGKLLRQLAGQFGNNLGLAAAAYNAGPKRVSDWLGKRSALPGETRDYVRKITGRRADHWTSRAFAQGPEAALMPARAPCMAVAEEVDAQVKAAGAAKLMAELTAVASSRSAPDAKAFDKTARNAAPARQDWKRRTIVMARDVVKRVRAQEIREAATQRTIKVASRVAARLASRPLKKDQSRVAKADVAEKMRKPAVSRSNVPSHRTRYASAR